MTLQTYALVQFVAALTWAPLFNTFFALGEEIGWNKNTTYTVIKKCVAKGAIERIEPGFVCRPLIGKKTAQDEEVDDMIDRVFDGSVDLLFAALLRRETLTAEQIENLRRRVDELSGEQK